jgi:SAM-dependent methyltransferase
MDTISLKQNIKKYYDKEAEIREGKPIKPDWKVNVRKKFLSIVKQENKNTLLELGAGAGYDSLFFKENRINVIAIDLSKEMVKKCIEKNIEAYELDFYNLSSLNKKFDCIYAINTLLHVPKNDLSKVLAEINFVLNPNGLFYMGLYGGNDIENELSYSDIPDIPRFFAFHSEKYLKTLLEQHFKILSFEHIKIEDRGQIEVFYSIIMRKAE